MKKFALIAAMVLAAALLLTGCFGSMTDPTPTQMPAVDPTATLQPVPTDAPLMPSDAPLATNLIPDVTDLPVLPDTTDGLNVAPSPSASTNP